MEILSQKEKRKLEKVVGGPDLVACNYNPSTTETW